MAIICYASVTLLTCGTCGSAILAPDDRFGRPEHEKPADVTEWLKRHREGCPQREQAVPKTLPGDAGAVVAS